ncbi:hypothetical protein AAFF_G00340710 [Aldrovandia affinis]|uniref:Uncharacterized protein n=1 Tax=Aldrovandia affinis TaxID=143900 RepID=A0AAD7SL65_9TELE|nr:hypothetical protein AAFF_G00340710 [Aldrovandia affinis]
MVLKDMWTLSSLRDVLCEFMGTALFLFAGLGSVVPWHGTPNPAADSAAAPPTVSPPDPLRVGLAFGSSLVLVSVCLGSASSSGVHLNPAVTLAMVAGLRVTPWRAILYVGAQLLGALCASALLLGLVPTPLKGQVGLNELAPGVCSYQAFLMEMAITFLLVLCVIVTTRPKSPLQLLGPAIIGLSVTLGHLISMGLTGCGMNPARSFGPAVMAMDFHNHWVYWAGPCTGSLLAGLLHDLLLHPRWSCPGDWLAELREVFLKGSRKHPSNLERAGE